MTQNSEQVKAIAEKYANYHAHLSDDERRQQDVIMPLLISAITEALSAQPTEKKIIAILDDSVERETLRKALEQQSTAPTVTAEELWEKYSTGGDEEWRTMGKIGFLASISEATASLQSENEQLRKELELRVNYANEARELSYKLRNAETNLLQWKEDNDRLTTERLRLQDNIVAQQGHVTRLTAEVERLKLFRKNAVEFLLLSEKQGSIVSSSQCSDMEVAFASADDRFFVVDNSADDKYQNLGFVYRKASRGKV